MKALAILFVVVFSPLVALAFAARLVWGAVTVGASLAALVLEAMDREVRL